MISNENFSNLSKYYTIFMNVNIGEYRKYMVTIIFLLILEETLKIPI